MNLAPITLHHGERYGALTVLRKEGSRYRVGCACGSSADRYRAHALMRADGVRICRRCRQAGAAFKTDS